MNNDSNLEHDADGLGTACAQDARETGRSGTPKCEPRRGKDGRSVEGYSDNRNAMRHGLRASALPKGCNFIHRELRAFRRALEDATVEVHGGISIPMAAAINTACRAETHAQLCARWLRREETNLDANQRLSYSAAIVKASEARDKAIDRLGIDKRQHDPWSQLGNVLNAPSVTPTAPNAAEPQPGAQEGEIQ